MLMKKLMSLLSCLLAVAFVLSACGGGAAPTAAPAAATSAPAAPATSAPAATAAPAQPSGPVVVTWASNEVVTTLDDVDQYGLMPKRMVKLWADTLFDSDHAGKITPWVATAMPTCADDYLTCTVTIHSGIKFTDGTELKAADVANAFTRIVTDADLKNPRIWKPFLDKAEATDDTTVVFHFLKPMPNFQVEASDVPLFSKAAYDKDPKAFFVTAPLGTGPYKVVSADTVNGSVTFQRNEDWWGWTKDNKSNVDQINYKFIGEDTTRVSSVRTGEVDIAQTVPLDSLDTLKSDGLKVFDMPYYSNYYLLMNCKDGSIFADKNAREALSLSIDRQLLVESVTGGGYVATWPVMKGVEGYKDYPGYEYNVDKAKDLLSKTAYKGEELNFVLNPNLVHVAEVAQAVQSMAKDAGFNLKINIMDTGGFQDALFNGKYDINLSNFVYINASAFKLMAELWFSGVDVFKTGYKNADLDAIDLKAQGTMDPAARNTMLQDAWQILMDEYAPAIFVFNGEFADATVSNLDGYTVYPDSIVDLRFLQKK
jgi:peptide/nickel transport system substrate-binding protein